MRRWRSWAPTVFRRCRRGSPPDQPMPALPPTCSAIRRWSSCATAAAPADRLPGSLVFDLHDASMSPPRRSCCRHADAPRGERRTAGAAPCRRGREVAIRVSGRRHVRADHRVRRGGTASRSGRSGGGSAAAEPGLGAWADRAQPHRGDAGQAVARPAPADSEARGAGAGADQPVDRRFPGDRGAGYAVAVCRCHGVVAADAWLRLRGPDEPPAAWRSHLIRPN